ncbi:MAG TPA: protein translocase subunit SecF [Sulfurihydrogenibium azorense]|uniref:Protein-export membrane protein SecF n=1 Tax=Sulfurihydrogenibium azorense TaxID=309806 RepID=A0A831YDF3_9AQUI|nr:MAG: protein translocase subunit SecF [Sulfurihydrogenibium sp.]HEV08851.1 protein translocase subunit SecF [Sulfurihydrogenibium azorense]
MRNFLVEPPNIDFLKIRKLTYVFSFSILILSLVLFFTKGFNFGLDFTGGTSVQIKFNQPIKVSDIRMLLREVNLDDAMIQELGTEKKEIEIRVSVKKGSSSVIVENIKKALDKKYQNQYEIRKIEFIDALVGSEMVKASIYSVVFVMLGILLFVGYRYEPVFALAAIVPLFFDTLVTLGLLSLLGKEIDLTVIAALLTVLGYSLNDKVIVFDRIRENIRQRGKKNLESIINRSINVNLGRTVITSGTVLMSVIAIYFFGGESLNVFALTLLIGVILATYSSIYLAAPLILEVESLLRIKSKKQQVGA